MTIEQEQTIPKWELIKDVYKNYTTVRKNFWWLFILLLINVVFIVAEPYFYKQFIDNLQIFASGKISYESIKGDFIYLAIIWSIISIFGVMAWLGYEFFTMQIMQKDWKKFTLNMGNSFIYLPYIDFINSNPGAQQSIFGKGDESFWQIGWNILISIIPQILIFISLFSFGFYINWKMTLVSLIFIPFSILITFKVGAKAYEKQKIANEGWSKSYQKFNDAIGNMGIVKVFAKEKQTLKSLELDFSETIGNQTKANLFWTLIGNLLKLVQVFGRISVMIFGVFFAIKGYLTVGELLIFIFISGRITGPIDSLLSSYQIIIRQLADFYKAKQIIDSTKEKNEGTFVFGSLMKNIEFRNVEFSYEKSGRKILKNLNLVIDKGQKVALVGHTGSGKTTISNLVTRFYEVVSGEVLVDGVNINNYELESYRSRLAAVFQDTTVFNDTILNNLKYIRQDASLDEIKDACKKAEILDFIEKLENGFETEVGEKGLKLSGGERQRIAIARAILRDPDILILDEPTSALDAKTESIIQKSLNNLMKGRTSIVIAHRLSTIKNADKILLLSDGEVIASGSHDELYEKSLVYKEMVDYQKNGFLEE